MLMDKMQNYKYDKFIGVIWGIENSQPFQSLTETLPSILIPLGSRNILSYQLAFMLRNHIHCNLFSYLDVLIPVKEKHAALVSSYIEQRKIEDMNIEVIPIKGSGSVNQVFSSISEKIDVSVFIMNREIS
jgi:NDP-sugar pyrophosphorylase family protein